MGADIHGWIEVKESDGDWTGCYLSIPLGPRNYLLFGLLAGVRALEDPLVQPRGLPDDVCSLMRGYVKDMGMEHSLTYLSLSELKKVRQRYKKFSKAHNYSGQLDALDMWIGAMEAVKRKTRIVFGFDS